MYDKILEFLKERPQNFAPSTAPFWDDEHISKGMLEAHLNPDFDGASRRLDFVKKSADFICGIRKIKNGDKLLDLGCGPGIYTEMFYDAGYTVTGIDFSRRSVNYAKEHARSCQKDIEYIYMNYLDIDYEDEFDVVTLIYCDFGALSPQSRAKLLIKINRALKIGGILILDGFTENQIKDFSETRTVSYNENGFWSPVQHMIIESRSLYKEHQSYLEQYIVVTEKTCECYNIWNQIYNEKTLKDELMIGKFSDIALFDDVSGMNFTGKQNTICAVAVKRQ